MINIAIVDDDNAVCKDLEKMLNKLYPHQCNIVVANSFDEYIYMQEDSVNCLFDIVLMDIVLDSGLGTDLAIQYEKINKKTKVIFITGYIDYAPDIFRAKPFDLLRKPITEEQLKVSIDKALDRLKEEENNYVQLISSEKIINVKVSDIIYIESYARKITVHTSGDSISVYMKMDEFEKKINGNFFIRTHQSFLVNPKYISKMERTKLLLQNEEEIPISRNRKEKCRDELLDYIAYKK